MPSILFVCTANRFRSPLSAAFFMKQLQKNKDTQGWVVESAGTWADPGLAVAPSSDWVMNQFGLDLKAHQARRIDLEVINSHDLILVMEDNHLEALGVEFPHLKDRMYLLANAATGVAYNIPDPGVVAGDTFLSIGMELSELIDTGFQRICLLAHQLHVEK